MPAKLLFLTIFFIFHFSFFIPTSAQAQIVSPPGVSCDLLTGAPKEECKKALCPSGLICNRGKCVWEDKKDFAFTGGEPEFVSALPCNYTLEDLAGAGVRVATFIFGIAGSLALLFFAYGGYAFFTSLGNPEEIQKGKKILTGSFVGLIIILASGFLVRFVARLILPSEQALGPGLELNVGSACSTPEQCGGGMTCDQGVCKTKCETDPETKNQGYACQALACLSVEDCAQTPTAQVCFQGGCMSKNEQTKREQNGEKEEQLDCKDNLCPGNEPSHPNRNFNRCCKRL